VQLFYEAYYQSECTRLYNFDGKAVTTDNVTVISYEERQTKDNQTYKVITTANQYPTYDEAQAYIKSQTSGNYRIVGVNPFISPCPYRP